MCNRRVEGLWNDYPKMCHPLEGSKFIDYFLYFLSVAYFKEVIMVQMTEEMQNGEKGKMAWGGYFLHGDLVFDVDSGVWRISPQLLLPGPHQSLERSAVAVGNIHDGVDIRMHHLFLAPHRYATSIVS